VLPDYRGPVLSGLARPLVAGDAAPWVPRLPETRATVLFLVDGLGWNAIESHRSMLPTLASMDGGPITTVVPSTTATALTSLTTGRPPADHGLIGFRMPIEHTVMNVLRWQRADGRRPPDPYEVQRHPAFFGREVPVVTKSEFRTTGFTDAHLRGTRFCGWAATSSLVEWVRRLVVEDRSPFTYAYYPGVDTVAHIFGLHDGFYEAELRAADRLVGDLLEVLPSWATLLITADHGQVHVGPDGWLSLDPIASLFDTCWGDGRFRYLRAVRGGAADLAAAAREEYGGRAWVLTADQVVEEGWLGPTPGRMLSRRIGDVVLAARDPVAFADPDLPQETQLIGAHGSVTPDEMLVPLLARSGDAR
jgi:Type I phosphodiesterase / nucleotide pyrophosphatase